MFVATIPELERKYGTAKVAEIRGRANQGSVEAIKQLANWNYVVAQFNLGSWHFYGKNGLPENQKEGFTWWLRAANRGYPNAKFRVGVCYGSGEEYVGGQKASILSIPYILEAWVNGSDEAHEYWAQKKDAETIATMKRWQENKMADTSIVGKWEWMNGTITFDFFSNGDYLYVSPNIERLGRYQIEGSKVKLLTATSTEFIVVNDYEMIMHLQKPDGEINKSTYTRL